jgi:hypothetical protein
LTIGREEKSFTNRGKEMKKSKGRGKNSRKTIFLIKKNTHLALLTPFRVLFKERQWKFD